MHIHKERDKIPMEFGLIWTKQEVKEFLDKQGFSFSDKEINKFIKFIRGKVNKDTGLNYDMLELFALDFSFRFLEDVKI